MSTQVFRVIVRGRFAEVSDGDRSALLEDAAEHEALRARFSRKGTFTYDRRIDFFSFRYEIRVQSVDVSGDGTAEAFDLAIAQAGQYLDHRGLAHRDLRATGGDLGRMWD